MKKIAFVLLLTLFSLNSMACVIRAYDVKNQTGFKLKSFKKFFVVLNQKGYVLDDTKAPKYDFKLRILKRDIFDAPDMLTAYVSVDVYSHKKKKLIQHSATTAPVKRDANIAYSHDHFQIALVRLVDQLPGCRE